MKRITGPRGKLRLLAVVVLGAAVVFGAARAWATPGSAASSVFPARGFVPQEVVIGVPATTTVTKRVRFRVAGKIVTRRVTVRVRTVRPLARCGVSAPSCETLFQVLTIQPGGYTGWHTHPGPTFVAVAQGEGTLYHGMPGCPSFKYGRNTGFFQPESEVHNMRNEGREPLVLHAFYTFPNGTPLAGNRIDQPQPADCPNIP
jgi:mannose-6-phosphate isomerase-like protein (cupin superfamily)